jgi:hypothetical protein
MQQREKILPLLLEEIPLLDKKIRDVMNHFLRVEIRDSAFRCLLLTQIKFLSVGLYNREIHNVVAKSLWMLSPSTFNLYIEMKKKTLEKREVSLETLFSSVKKEEKRLLQVHSRGTVDYILFCAPYSFLPFLEKRIFCEVNAIACSQIKTSEKIKKLLDLEKLSKNLPEDYERILINGIEAAIRKVGTLKYGLSSLQDSLYPDDWIRWGKALFTLIPSSLEEILLAQENKKNETSPANFALLLLRAVRNDSVGRVAPCIFKDARSLWQEGESNTLFQKALEICMSASLQDDATRRTTWGRWLQVKQLLQDHLPSSHVVTWPDVVTFADGSSTEKQKGHKDYMADHMKNFNSKGFTPTVEGLLDAMRSRCSSGSKIIAAIIPDLCNNEASELVFAACIQALSLAEDLVEDKELTPEEACRDFYSHVIMCLIREKAREECVDKETYKLHLEFKKRGRPLFRVVDDWVEKEMAFRYANNTWEEGFQFIFPTWDIPMNLWPTITQGLGNLISSEAFQNGLSNHFEEIAGSGRDG